MAHEVLWSHDYNGFIRQIRSMMLNNPRVNRANDHDDINNLGVAYTLGGGGSRPAGDILHVAAEASCPLTTHRATAVVGTAAGGAYQSVIQNTVTFNTVARTIVDDGGGDWLTAGVVVGDLIRIENAATAGNNGVWRVLSVTTGGSTNDTITLNTLDTLAASDAADAIDVYPITGGSIFDVREDQPGSNTHIGWMTDDVEFMAKDGSIFLFMRSGGSWAVTDYAEWTMEAGAFTLFDEWTITRTVDLNENGAGADTISRNDYNGNFLRDGFESGEQVEVIGSVGEDGVYPIVTAAAKLLTLNIGDFTADELGVEVQLIPRQTVTVNFDDADATFGGSPPTIVRTTGSWIERGYLPGGQIEITDAVTAGNNATWLIDSIDTETNPNDTLILVAGSAITDGISDVITATPRNGILQAWTEHRFRWSATSGSTGSASQSLDSGELPPIPNADRNYTSEWVGIGPGDDPVNNPQTIYLGFQSQFSGTTLQNVEMRGFDSVSDSSFSALGNASPPTYIYLTRSPSMETFFTGDGAHVTGLLDVNTSVTEWFYLGFGNVHGSQNQHPRPMLIGGTGWQSGATRSSTGDRLRFFPRGADYTGTTSDLPKSDSCCWHRWVDGQWFSVGTFHQRNATQVFASNSSNVELHTWPWGPNGGIALPFDGGAQNHAPDSSTANVNPSGRNMFPEALRQTPTSITPNPNQEYLLLPTVVVMRDPDLNVVADFRNIFFTPGDAQATKNRILQGDHVYIVGQNHEKTGQQDFAALRLA
jgi:hypothetical protein